MANIFENFDIQDKPLWSKLCLMLGGLFTAIGFGCALCSVDSLATMGNIPPGISDSSSGEV